jgi:hypothetical protein
MKAEGTKLRVERLELQYVLGPANRLDPVAIDQPNDVTQLVVGNE